MNGIVWLASYPKSGNTWFRSFLTNLVRDGDEPVHINDMDGGPIASSRPLFDDVVGYDSADLTPEEAERLRPEVYLHTARRAEETLFCKVHDACTSIPGVGPLFPAEATRGVIYLVRNPLDVCISFSHHNGHQNINRTIRQMEDPEFTLARSRESQANQLPQRLLTWSGHVTSWIDAPNLKVHVVRYEDMKLRTEETFTMAARFAGLPDSPDRIRKAIAFSSFDELKKQEEKDGFAEKMPRARSFFRKGEAGAWRETLSQSQVSRITKAHGPVMRRLGYLDAEGLVPGQPVDTVHRAGDTRSS